MMNIFRNRKTNYSELKLDDSIVIGTFMNGEKSPEHFRVSEEFKTRFYELISAHGTDLNSLKEAASEQQNGYVYLIDHRTPDGILGNVPAEDIIGAFQVKNGNLVNGSYQANQNYKFYTKDGKPQLPPELLNMLKSKY